jgi:hypothetical protein
MARYRWLIGLFVIGLLVMVGGYAYQAGIAQGLAQSGNLAAPGAAAAAIMWRHPWGFGFFPFFPIFPIFFFILFWGIVLRGVFWRRRFPGYWHGPGYGPEYSQGVPPMFNEWHRRAHARDKDTPESKA